MLEVLLWVSCCKERERTESNAKREKGSEMQAVSTVHQWSIKARRPAWLAM